MSSKYLAGTYAAGYTLSGTYSAVTLGTAGSIGGSGVTDNRAGDTFVNLGRIVASKAVGIDLAQGGGVINGSPAATTARVQGTRIGIEMLFGTGSITNDAMIKGGEDGIYFGATGTIRNGAATDTKALIQGEYGVVIAGAGTLVNYGQIRGSSTAVLLQSAKSVLVVEAGSQVQGIAEGGGGTLELGAGGGAGTLANFHNYQDFGAIDVLATADWTLATVTVASGTRLVDGGTLAVTGNLLVDGTLDVTGSLAVAGTLTLDDGGLTVGPAGSIGTAGVTVTLVGTGSGVYGLAGAPDTVTNDGTIFGDFYAELGRGGVGGFHNNYRTATGPAAVYLKGGGRFTNGAAGDTAAQVIGGNYGVFSPGLEDNAPVVASVVNFGTINGVYVGVYLVSADPIHPDTITNGSAKDTAALIYGASFGVYTAGSVTLVNDGTIEGGDIGASLDRGLIRNGSATDTVALIESGTTATGIGVSSHYAAATVVNDGTIQGNLAGISMTKGGRIVNGSKTDTAALIVAAGGTNGAAGITAAYQVTIVNYGTVECRYTGTVSGGIVFGDGGFLRNGSTGDRTALVSGGNGPHGIGVATGMGGATIANYGTIQGYYVGIRLLDGGTVVNGSAGDRTALVESGNGTFSSGILAGASATVVNFGTISGKLDGVSLLYGGRLVNGSATDTTALIETPIGTLGPTTPGLTGAIAGDAASFANYGTIVGGLAGIILSGRITNGSEADRAALIEGGDVGVSQGKTGTLIVDNFGTIDGAAGTAVGFYSANDLLIVEAGSTLIGKALGDGGTLELGAGGGAGTLTGLGGVYTGFSQIEAATGATWTLAGSNTIASGTTLTGLGRLSITGSLTNAGVLAGAVTLASGVLTNGAHALIGGTLTVVGGSLRNAGTINSTVHISGGTLVNQSSGKLDGQPGAAGGNGGATGTVSGTGHLTNNGSITGGAAGAGGSGSADGGTGGIGGTGIVIAAGGSLVNQGTIAGGAGGDGGNGSTYRGSGGAGGAGVLVSAGGRVTNDGVLLGGAGGTYGTGAMPDAGAGDGAPGAGAVVAGGYLANFGTIGVLLSALYGAVVSAHGTLINHGTIDGFQGALSIAGNSSITNGSSSDTAALIDGEAAGIYSGHGGSRIANWGTIEGGVIGIALKDGAAITNGSTADTTALIDAHFGIVLTPSGILTGTIANFGTISGVGNAIQADRAGLTIETLGTGAVITSATAAGVALLFGGTILNAGTIYGAVAGIALGYDAASVTNRAGGLIKGAIGLETGNNYATAVTVTNFGTIDGTGGTSILFEAAKNVLVVENGSTLVGTAIGGNGTLDLAGDEGAGTLTGLGSVYTGFGLTELAAGVEWTLAGSNSVAAGAALRDAGTLVNAGSLGIGGTFTVTGSLQNTGSITGGITLTGGVFTNATGAVVFDRIGTLAGSAASLTNLGTIQDGGGVVFQGGRITNATTALIAGGIRISGGRGTIGNDGTIAGIRTGAYNLAGIALGTGGLVTNGGTADTTALIQGGVKILGATGTIANFGTIDRGVIGVYLGAGGRVTNGAASDPTALIDGGVRVAGAGTVINYGTIEGSGPAVQLAAASGVLVVEAGSTLVGAAVGDGSTLEFGAGGGAGTITGLGNSAVYSGFSHYQVNAGANWTLAGSHTIAGGFTEGAGATLTVGSTLTLTGSGDHLSGMIDGAGTVSLDDTGTIAGLVIGGTLTLDNQGTITATGQLTIGDATAAIVQVTNLADGVIDITGNSGIGRGTGASLFSNAGLLEKTGGAAASTIAIAVTNSGTIEAALGRLNLAKSITGTGDLTIAASATLGTSGAVGSGQTVRFAGAHADLIIADAAGFKAALAGFAATDALDLTGFGTGTKVGFVENGAKTQGTLTVTHGTTVLKLTLLGQYANSFTAAPDGAGGTLISYTPPPRPAQIAMAP